METITEITAAILNAFEKRNPKKLRKINDESLRKVVITFTPALSELAVLSYVLSKIISKTRFLEKSNETKLAVVRQALADLACAKDESEIIRKCELVLDAIKSMDEQDQRFIIDLASKGRLKVGATAYAQGVSLGTASEMTGIDKQEIMDYAGKTMMFDRVKEEKSIQERLSAARRLIKK